MKSVNLPGTDITTSNLGFGCASLGSRVSKGNGLRSLARAHDLGVTWYDLAPIYGAGQAEAIFSHFLADRRHKVHVCTKVGLERPGTNGMVRLASAVARPLLQRFQGLRAGIRRVNSQRNVKSELSAEFISNSLDSSLRELGTDYIDVLALHDPAQSDLMREDIWRALEDAVTSGRVRYISIAGDPEAIRQVMADELPCQFLQFADDPDSSILYEVQQTLKDPKVVVTHSILGVGGALDALKHRLNSDAQIVEELGTLGYEGDLGSLAADLLLDRALIGNSSGVVLSSMFSDRHLENNTKRVDIQRGPEVLEFINKLFSVPGARSVAQS